MPFLSNVLAALAVCVLQDDATTTTAHTASQFLHWLYMVAAVLAVVLILVIALAVNIWRKNKNADSDSDRSR